jgi:hypothetical protein
MKQWSDEEIARLHHMRDVLHLPFQDIGLELGRSREACKIKYNTIEQGRILSCDALDRGERNGLRVSVTREALADRDARYQAWLRQSPAAALMGDPLPGRSALDQRRQSEAQ